MGKNDNPQKLRGDVLVVDDNEEMLELISEYFSDKLKIHTAKTTTEAWTILRTMFTSTSKLLNLLSPEKVSKKLRKI